MGSSLHVYVGPYLMLKETPTIYHIDKCLQKGCTPTESKFCPDCGADRESAVATRQKCPSDLFFNETHVDVLIKISPENLNLKNPSKKSFEISYAISNSSKAPGNIFDSSKYGVQEISEGKILEEKDGFRKHHQGDIEALRNLGVKVELHWGVLAYCY